MSRSSVERGEKITRIVKACGPIWISELSRMCRCTKKQVFDLVDQLPHVHIPNAGKWTFNPDGSMGFNFQLEWSETPVFPDEEIVGALPITTFKGPTIGQLIGGSE